MTNNKNSFSLYIQKSLGYKLTEDMIDGAGVSITQFEIDIRFTYRMNL